MTFTVNIKDMINGFLRVRDEDDLYERLDCCARDLGFARFAMGHHVDLLGPPGDAIRMSNYDQGWVEQALAERYYVQDPVHRASTKTAAGFLWSDMSRMVRLTRRQIEILEVSHSYGLCEGYTVPVHVPGEYRGTCSFGGPNLVRLAENALPLANMAGIYAFEAARRLMRIRNPIPLAFDDLPLLTGRQHDTLVLVARGKGDPEIGHLLGISSSTAHEHVENVRRAYGNAQRPYLVARALFDGQISYTEAFGR